MQKLKPQPLRGNTDIKQMCPRALHCNSQTYTYACVPVCLSLKCSGNCITLIGPHSIVLNPTETGSVYRAREDRIWSNFLKNLSGKPLSTETFNSPNCLSKWLGDVNSINILLHAGLFKRIQDWVQLSNLGNHTESVCRNNWIIRFHMHTEVLHWQWTLSWG